MRAKHYLIAATVLTGIIFVSANLLVQKVFSGARIDFTENNLYTLSDATRSTLKSVAEPVEITFVYTRATGQEFPAIRAYAARVRELLQVYESQSGGKVRITEIDPVPFSPAEDEALAAGITAIDTNGNDPLYFGLIGRNSIDDQRVMPFLAPEREVTLEYDLTRMIDRLDDPDPPRIGILSSLPGMTAPGGEGGYALLRDIHKSFDVEPIAETFQSLPEDLDVLLVAQPPELSPRQEWLIDQFVLRTGRAVFLLDPAAKTAGAGGPFALDDAAASASLPRLGEAWGVSVSERAVADAASALPVPVDTGGGRIEELAHPLFLGIPAGDMNQEDLITADLGRVINFGAPGALITGTLGDGVEFTPLMTTGPSPSFIEAEDAITDMSPQQVLRQYQTEAGPLVLAGRLSGPLRTAFPEGPPPFEEPADPMLADIARTEAAGALPHISASETDVQVILVADADFIADDFYVIPNEQIVVADNGALVLNALDALAGGGDLSRLRSRAPSLRRMERIDRMRENAEAIYFRQQAELQDNLEAAQGRLEELQAIGAADGFFSGDLEADLTEAERTELLELRQRIVTLRAQLREIERNYRRDIDRLEGTLKAINIWSGPLLVCLIGLFVWYRQKRKGAA